MSQRERARSCVAASCDTGPIVESQTNTRHITESDHESNANSSHNDGSDDGSSLSDTDSANHVAREPQSVKSLFMRFRNEKTGETNIELLLQERARTFPLADMPTMEQCRADAAVLSEEIFASWNAINTVLVFSEQIIRKRWTKMNQSQKKELLLTAWPDMNPRHRPDIERMFSDRAGWKTRPVGIMNFQEYAWPYINLEDLLRPKAFLMLLNSRGRNRPDAFAYSDLDLAPHFKVRKEFLRLRKDNVTMAFIGRHSAKSYGEFIEWTDGPSAARSINEGRSVHVDHGIQILWIQEGVLYFLRRCIGLLLDDMFKRSPVPDMMPQPEPPPLTAVNGVLTLHDVIAREAPYQLPCRLDLGRLQALANAQKSQAIEHVMLLREDPAYFAETTERYRSHRAELLLDKYGGSHPHAKNFPLYNKSQRQLASDAYCAVFVWHEIYTRLVKLGAMSAQFADTISVEKDLPRYFIESLAETKFFLETISQDLIEIIKFDFNASPPLRKYHYRGNPNDPNLGIYQTMQYTHIDRDDKVVQHILQLIRIFEDGGMRELATVHVLLDEFERLMQDEPRAKVLITPHMAASISQLSIMSECLNQFNNFQPWATRIASMIKEHHLAYELRYGFIFQAWGNIIRVHEAFRTQILFKAGYPGDGKFYYPSEKRRTRETTNAMISAERALDTFWRAANSHWLRHVGTTPAALVQHIIGDRSIQRTSPWVEPPPALCRSVSPSPLSIDSIAFSEHAHDISKQLTGTFNKLAVSVKEKKKTRGLAIENGNAPAVSNIVDRVSPQIPTLQVDKRAYKVFSNLFHSPNAPNQPGQVAWPDFLHAMVKAGFASEKLQGSAWHFTPHNLDLERSIQFHEPHPGNKLPLASARRYGRRLTRAFGWSLESFTLA